MTIIFVTSHPRDWTARIPGVEIVPARSYLADPSYGERNDAEVFNLCRSYRYQKRGYYVSLLAEARGHKPLPDAKAIEDLHSDNLIPFLAASLDDLIQCSLAPVEDDECALTIHFGRDAGRRHAHLAEQLFNVLRLPLLHVHFRRAQGRWRLDRARTLNIAEIAPHEME
ncbi:MAG TPA: RimK-like ATPgrasp N-terminal domain-containing protein, partial [Burkholderiaceae bacterium]|nr:RimK-like ATPgrasp N-terminal domain-containing protein [Burkholderiaceae bacterium]